MAEKKTLSILETIKKKMHKLDRKTEAAPSASAIGDEFEYIAVAKKPGVEDSAKSQPKEDHNLETKDGLENLSDILEEDGFEDFEDEAGINEEVEEKKKDNVEAVSNPTNDDLEFPASDPLDELEFAKEEEPAAEAATVAEPEAASELNLEENQAAKELPSLDLEAEPSLELESEPSLELESEPSLELESEPTLDLETEPTLGLESEPNLDLEKEANLDLEASEEVAAAPIAELKTEEFASENSDKNISEQDHDDFDFSDLEKDDEELPHEEVAVEQENPHILEASQEDAMDSDLDLDELPQQQVPATKAQEPFAIEKDEIDLEFEKEMMGFKPKENLETSFSPNNFSQRVQPNFRKTVLGSSASSIVSDKTAVQASESIQKLINAQKTVLAPTKNIEEFPFNDAATQMLEQKLTKWLDENLAVMVEKIVREEIQKIIPKS